MGDVFSGGTGVFDADEAFRLIATRRSTRAYAGTPVDDGALRRVVEAGRLAPSGGNSQTTHFLVIRDGRVLDELAALVCAEFAKMEVTEGMYRSLVHSISASKKGGYVFHYGAPVLIVTANRVGYGNNIADCACALENMMLMANALGLGSCWINQLRWLNGNDAVCAYLAGLGLQDGEKAYGALALGLPATPDGLPARKPLARTGNPVTWIG
ncbi:MAG: nitroreductase [Mailhella sp.]|nr:nitroreductase [Mailhella sp.]